MRYGKLISIHRLHRKINFGPLPFFPLVYHLTVVDISPEYPSWFRDHGELAYRSRGGEECAPGAAIVAMKFDAKSLPAMATLSSNESSLHARL